jgi:hypothetical protein
LASILQFGAILNELKKQATQLPVFDAHECLRQRQSIGTGKKLVHVGGSCSRRVSSARGAFEKERDRHLEDLRELLQAAGTDAVPIRPSTSMSDIDCGCGEKCWG